MASETEKLNLKFYLVNDLETQAVSDGSLLNTAFLFGLDYIFLDTLKIECLTCDVRSA